MALKEHRIIRYVLLLCAVSLIATTGATAGSLITSAKIQNGTVAEKDLAKKVRAKLNRKTGALGPQGLQGPLGAPGTTGNTGTAGPKGDTGSGGGTPGYWDVASIFMAPGDAPKTVTTQGVPVTMTCVETDPSHSYSTYSVQAFVTAYVAGTFSQFGAYSSSIEPTQYAEHIGPGSEEAWRADGTIYRYSGHVTASQTECAFTSGKVMVTS